MRHKTYRNVLVTALSLFSGLTGVTTSAQDVLSEDVTIHVSLRPEKLSGKGEIAPGLVFEIFPQDFKIVEDGGRGKVTQEAFSVGAPAEPHSLVLLVEGWGLGRQAYYDPLLEALVGTADAFLEKLDEKDYVALVTYDMRPRVEVDFKRRNAARDEIRGALAAMYRQGSAGGFIEANIFDSLTSTLEMLRNQPGHKSIVLITKGINTFSARGLDDVRQKIAENPDVTVYVVSILDILLRWGYEIPPMARSTMTTLAEESGGIAVFPRFEGDLIDYAEAITAAMHNQRTLTYRAKPVPVKGKRPVIKIRVECIADVDKDGKPDKFKVYHKQTRVPQEN